MVELEAPDLDVEEGAENFKRLVAVAVVLVTLFGSVVAYLQAVDSNREDVAARDAQRDAVAGLGEQVDASAALAADLRIGSAVDIELQRAALNAARVSALTGDADSDIHLAAQQRFAAVAETIATLTPVDPADPATIDSEFARRNESPDAARLRQAVQADLANDHGGRADAFIAVLTVLAVSLFLLGLSLTVQGRSRYVLVGPGVLIAVVCVAWTVIIGGREVTRVSERSIQLAAEGQRLSDGGDLEAAIDAYDDAIDDSPDFAAAYARRASAHFLAGSPQTGQTSFVSVTSDDALEVALDDLDTALSLGADSDVITLGEAGFNNFLAGNFDRSAALSREALELNDALAPVWFNLGVALVAQADEDEAERAYREGLRALENVIDAGTRSQILAGARTDLSILRDLLDGDDLDDAEDLIVATEVELAAFELESAGCDSGPCSDVDVDAGDAEVGEATFTRDGAFVFTNIGVEGLEAGDPVAATWYFRTDDDFPFQQAFGSFDAPQVADGSIDSVALPSISPACPVAGEFLVRLYAGGEFLDEVEGTIEPTLFGDEFIDFTDRLEGIEACVPAGHEVERADVSELDEFTTFGREGEAVLMGVNVTPGSLLEGEDPDQVVEAIFDGTMPGIPTFPVRLAGRDLDGNFVSLDGLFGVDEANGVAVAIALGPDSSARNVVLTGEVSEELLLETIGLITFTGVGAAVG